MPFTHRPSARRWSRLLPAAGVLVALLAGTTGVALAHGGGGPGHHGMRGTVGTVAAPTFTVVRAHGPEKTVTTSAATKYVLTADATVADAIVGAHVKAHGTRGADGTLLARSLAIVPAPPTPPAGVHHGPGADSPFANGVVTSSDGTTVKITDASGGTQTIKTDAKTKVTKTAAATFADVVAGRRVSVRGTRNADGTFAATLVVLNSVTHPEPAVHAEKADDDHEHASTTTNVTAAARVAAQTAATTTPDAPLPAAGSGASGRSVGSHHGDAIAVGTVGTVATATFTVVHDGKPDVVVTTNADTRFFLAGSVAVTKTAAVTFAAVVPGLHVVVKGQRTDAGAVTAMVVFLNATPPAIPGIGHAGDHHGDPGEGGDTAADLVHASGLGAVAGPPTGDGRQAGHHEGR